MESRFGLPRKALVDAFYAMDVAPGQTLSSFVMSVEDKRARLSIDKESCFRTHAPKLEKAGLLDLDGPSDYAVRASPCSQWCPRCSGMHLPLQPLDRDRCIAELKLV